MNVRLPRSFTFRLALTYMSLFGVSVLLLMLFIYWSTASYMARQSDALIEAEIGGLAERYDLLGLDGLIALIKERLSRQPTGLSIYLLTTDDYTRLAGNLDRWPVTPQDGQGWIDFRLVSYEGGEELVHQGRARRFALTGGFHLFVGRDISPLVGAKERIAVTLAWGLALTLVLGGLGIRALRRAPVRVTLLRLAALAMPKSTTCTPPSKRTITLEGETSRCTTDSGRPRSSCSSCA